MTGSCSRKHCSANSVLVAFIAHLQLIRNQSVDIRQVHQVLRYNPLSFVEPPKVAWPNTEYRDIPTPESQPAVST